GLVADQETGFVAAAPGRCFEVAADIGIGEQTGLDLEFSPQRLGRLARTLRRTGQDAGVGGHVTVQPGAHFLRLLVAALGEAAPGVATVRRNVLRFGVAPQDQIHAWLLLESLDNLRISRRSCLSCASACSSNWAWRGT